jgi:hypothetical protein
MVRRRCRTRARQLSRLGATTTTRTSPHLGHAPHVLLAHLSRERACGPPFRLPRLGLIGRGSQACFELAVLHSRGACGAALDPAACLDLLGRAAALGHAQAAYNLACRKLKGAIAWEDGASLLLLA